jgi:hypothetical protein
MKFNSGHFFIFMLAVLAGYYWLNNRQHKWLLHGKRARFLERPVSIFLGHLSHQRDSPLDRSIQIFPRRMPFDKTHIRAIVLG